MESVNLQKSYAAVNEKLAHQFDESGVKRSFTVPYLDGQSMDEHVASVGQAAQQSGGLTKNLVTSAHHSSGKGWGSGDGHTVGHPGEALRHTVIPKDDEHAKATIRAAQKHLDNIASLLGEDEPAVKTAQGQLNLVKKTDAAGMNLLDFGVMMQQIMYAPNQAIARAHQGTKPDGHSPKLAPARGGAAPQVAPDQSQPPADANTPAAGASAAAPAQASGAPAPVAPAAEQAQG